MDRNWCWILILILCTSCLKNIDIGNHYVFTIPSGVHASTNAVKIYDQNELSFAFKFNESAEYDLGNINQFDTNKLFGFKYGLDPHKNSARFGWRWDIDNKYIIIVAYSYVNGVRDIYDIGYCFIGEIYSGEIKETASEIIYKFQGIEYSINKGKSNLIQKYYLYPYFGGNEKAPHNINVELWF